MDNLILIDRDKIQIVSGGNILSLGLAQTMVRDLEVVNKELLMNEISGFLQKNEIVMGKTLVLLSESVCFISEKANFIQDFTATLPFENPAAIEFDGKYVGTNRDLYDIVISAIGKKGAMIKGVSPLFLAKEMLGKRDLTPDVIDLVNANEAAYTKGSFNFNIPPSPPAVIETKAKNNKVTLILVSVFAVLLVILLVMVL